jgi:two-component sensor histidine kinase/PAS domain-containing protein
MDLSGESRIATAAPWSPSGLATVPHLQWGNHLAHFFDSGDDLRDLLVPYFKAGLEHGEKCLWVVGAPFGPEDARSALRAAVPDFDERERRNQIEIVDGGAWYSADTKIQPKELVEVLIGLEQDALSRGFSALRTNGNCSWVSDSQWADFLDYEARVQEVVRGRRMICLCSYCAQELGPPGQLEVMERHDMAIPAPSRRPVAPRESRAAEPSLKSLEHQKRQFDLAMMASNMGTWRYTFADNMCVYDENAQRLYGLTEARFLHDEEGVMGKFHPEDLDLMWSRVAAASDPSGDGRYDVEYRVKQLDGGWRWLSAWGLVEFEGEGEDRKPVAIVGASRDLTDRKQAEELQRILLAELGHRFKNTLATIQAITAQTLTYASDLSSAREAVDRRICAMAKANQMLTARNWDGAMLRDVIEGALDPFDTTRIRVNGPNCEISPRHTLALSLGLHELATNATKYGALSNGSGVVDLRWVIAGSQLMLDWTERGGPRVAPPATRGFGSRLLERLLGRDLGGEIRIDYRPDGLHCIISAAIAPTVSAVDASDEDEQFDQAV